MALAHKLHHIVVEGAAGTALSALLSGRVDVKGRRVGVVVSGGNVDDSKFVRILNENQ
jgi:threonine dehydratase